MSVSDRARAARQKLCATCPHGIGARSLPQHRRLFGLIKAARLHWPEKHDFQPFTEEHLRKWLLCKAGHCSVRELSLADMDTGEAIALLEAAFHAAGAYSFVRGDTGRVRIFTAKSIAFDKLSHKAACTLFDEIGAVIENEIGIKADDLLKETEAAA